MKKKPEMEKELETKKTPEMGKELGTKKTPEMEYLSEKDQPRKKQISELGH